MADWIIDHMPKLFAAFVLLIAGLFTLAIWADVLAKDAFMQECQTYRPTYEYTAMWRSGESRSTTVIVPTVR